MTCQQVRIMQERRYKLIFEGKVQPGHTEESVKRQIKALFKADAGKMERLFSGAPIIIRNNIPQTRARLYESALIKAGAVCRILAVTGDLELPPLPPKIPKVTVSNTSYTAPPEEPPAKGIPIFHESSRLGRTRFLAWCWLVGWFEILAWLLPDYLSLLPGIMLTVQQTLMTAIGLHTLAGITFIIIISLRLHDVDRSAWLWVFLLIPGLNLLFIIWITFVRGSQERNYYGQAPSLPGNIARLFGFWIPLLTLLSMGGSAWFHQEALLQLVSSFPGEVVELSGF